MRILAIVGILGATMLSDVSFLQAATPAEPKLTAKGVEFFETRIRPTLVSRCYGCHSASAKEVKGGLLVDSREGLRKGGDGGAAVVPGEPAESLLLQAIKHENFEMPPNDRLPENVILDFEKWIAMGAPDPRGRSDANKKVSLSDARKFWSFQPVKKVAPPTVQNEAWPRGTIDRFILAKLEEQQLTPVGDADRNTWLRRVTFDLTGLPPTPEEIVAFQKDASPEAYATVVDRLLQSPHYGERWGRHWLDIARYGESSGKERNVPFNYAWRYRDYVIDAFNADTPYDRFIREQLAGDLLPAKNATDKNRNLVATGFLAIGTKGLNERKPEQFAADVADEQLDVATRAFLGITVACARCHDHKFDPIPQTDYYALAGVFRNTQILAGIERGNQKTGYEGKYAYLVSAGAGAKAEPSSEQKAELTKLQTELQELRTKLNMLELGLRNPKLVRKEQEAIEKRKMMYERLNGRIQVVQAQMKAIVAEGPKTDSPVMAVRDVPVPQNTHLYVRGEVDQLGPEVPRGIPAVLAVGRSPKFDAEGSGRTQLASWIASKENPLTARVMANRLWSHLFGRGLVESVDNFGSLGDTPTHPELLDFLAGRLVENGWSIKKTIREIVLSRAYGLSSEHHEKNYGVDADNRYVWRMSRRRLEAEAIRDAVLAASGRLDLNRPTGSPVEKLPLQEIGRGKNMYAARDAYTYRSVYLPMVRGAVPESLSVFDAADPSLAIGQREVTTVATQALFMMNSPFVMENCRALAEKMVVEHDTQPGERIDRLFLLILGRMPTSEERTNAGKFLLQYGRLVGDDGGPTREVRIAAWSALCQSLFATGEFRYVY